MAEPGPLCLLPQGLPCSLPGAWSIWLSLSIRQHWLILIKARSH